ncbi:Listeria-Bacteroides repeat domain (List_Bact_rpt) [Bifidobacterium catenulatum]|nr:InlB B-repeat-containing protein [Bifidobacterium catenulatum]VUX34640.1 Listeria-Bacteroides repeat domain (List_Bact_rpt) [Bifidobacterium catenulatum]
MGFITRLIAGLVAASTLGAGLAGTAGAVDTTGTTGDTKGVVKLASDDTSNLPDHLVNGDFKTNYRDQWVDSFDNWTSIDPNTGKTLHVTNMDQDSNTWKWTGINGWNRSQFGWTSTQKAGGSIQQKANAVELQYDDAADNVYAELCAYEKGTAIYQDIKTVPGTLYKIRLKHASLNQNYLDKMQVLIGAPGHETPVEMTRTTVNGHGDKLNEKSTTIATKVTNGNNRHHESQWETYEGTYLIPDGQTTTRFTFRSIDAKQLDRGNVLDDIVFDKAYRLSYDKNASDASGQVPSNERGRENTVQPAKAKTTGTVKTVADENVRYGSLANGDFSYPSFSDIQKNEQEGYADLRTFLKSDDGTLWYNMSATDLSKYGKIGQIPGFDSSRFAWSSTENGSRVELQQDRNTKNTYAEIVAQQDNTSIYQNVSTGNGGVLYKIRLKHASRQSSHADRMQVLVGSDTDHATLVEMTRVTSNGHGDKVGGKSTTIITKVSNTDPRDHGAQWETYEGYYQVPEGQKNTVFMFKSLEGFKEDETLPGNNIGNLVDDIEFSRSYRLTYDANSSDASGQVPSDTAANTVKQAKSKTNGSVRLAADDDVAEYAANGLPEQIDNGRFDYPSVPSWTTLGAPASNKNNKGKLFATINPGTGKYGSGCAMSTTGKAIPNWNRSSFAWNSTQGDAHYPGMSCEAGNVELNYDSVHHNQFAELTADQQGTAIYQDVKVTPGTMMKWSLKHSSATSAYVDKMQVMIGEPYKETAQEATRIASENGNKVGEKMTTISTPTTSDRADNKKWDTYSGTYLVPDGGTTVRFTFKSVASAEWYSGNDLDDIEFSRSYKLTYDKNSSDAAGEVPSNQRGKENTTQPAKDKTSGTVRLASDDDVVEYAANGLPKQIVNSDFDHDWQNIVSQSKMTGKYNFANVDPAHGDVEISGALNGKGEASKQWVHLNGFDAAKFGWKSNQTNTRVDGRGGIVEIQRSKANDNMYAEITASQANTYLYQDIDTAHSVPTVYTVKLRYAHRNGTVDSNEKIQILVGAPGHEQPVEMTRIASDRGNRLGEKSTTVNAPNTDGWLGSWDTFQGSVEIPAGQPVSRFTFKALGSIDGVTGNLIDDVQFKLAYPLSYDKNAQDATGSIPSDTAADTTRPAKSETDGKVSDLVQRTTTHEDGSVTVKTIDTSTDVVSGCQVYYPAGQRITLATMAKDDDCWDSSMLSRPGHTQLGWNQDRNATQAQAQVTMVEGGMTVYAVWVGNSVLTYDTNKPNTWNGQMPSTPASVSVSYNTAAADGSGWQSGDTSKIRGYRFLGWYAGPQDDAGLYDWNTLLTGNVTVYAHWERLKASVVYDRNAKDAKGSHANTTGWQYSDVTVPSDTSKSFKRDGYVFLGWDTQADGNGTAYKDGSQVPLQDKDITLYAQWQPVFEQFTPTGGVSLPLLVAGGVTLLVMGIGSTVMLTRRMRGEQ